MFNLFKPKEKLSLIKEKINDGRSYFEFTHKNVEYLAFYTNSGSSGTSIYNKLTEKYITRISINPIDRWRIKQNNIKNKEDFINRFLIPELDKHNELNTISNSFKN